MTTIAVKDGVMAADSLMTAGSFTFPSAVSKLHEVNGVLCGFCGDYKMIKRFLDEGAASPEVFYLSMGVDGDVCDNEMSECGYTLSVPVESGMSAVGTGSHFALGAMEAGASAWEAVKIASKYNAETGGDIFIAYYEKDNTITIKKVEE